MKKLKSVSARKISKRINTLNRLNLSKYEANHINHILRNSFRVPYNLFTQQVGKGFIFRACINETTNPFESIKRIAYNPNPNDIGRANLKNKGIGYGASSLDTAVVESCQDQLRNTTQRIFNLTVGEWAVDSDLDAVIICNNVKALSVGTDLDVAYSSIVKFKIENEDYNKKKIKIWELKNRFYANQFAKKEINSKKDYLFSAIYSNFILNSKKPTFDCIWFPSQAYQYKGFNIAYKPELVDSRKMTLNKVYDIEVNFSNNSNEYPTITIRKYTNKFINDFIQWS